MNVKNAALLFASLIFGLFVLMGVSLMHMTNLLDGGAKSIAVSGESIRVAQELKSFLLIHNRNTLFHSLNRNPDDPVINQDQRAKIPNLLAEMEQLVNSETIDNEEERSALAELDQEIKAYLARRDSLEASGLSSVEQYQEIGKDVDRTLAVVDRVIEINQSQMDQLIRTVDTQNKMADKIAYLLLTLGGLLLVSLLAMMFVSIAHPLKAAAKTILQYSSGSSSSRIRPSGLREIRQIGASFNSMADGLAEKRQEQLRFIAAIAHDLRNPLNSMSMASEALVRKSAPEDRKLADIISRQVKNLDRMVGDLLDTTRIESGHIDLNFSRHDINSLIEDCVKLYGASELHRFDIEVPDQHLFCECDGGRIAQVLSNLISNAVKYSPNGGVVTVQARDDGHAITVSVSDQGIGIAAEEIDSIFRPFQRSKATRGTIPGIGLGLSASRHIIEAHGGQLRARSNPGAGSTFCFTLPARTLRPGLEQPPPSLRSGKPGSNRPMAHRARLDQSRTGRLI
jgi:two-component system sensor histidine kinase MtrB